MAQLRPYRPEDWTSFLQLDLETQGATLGESTDAERETLRARWPALLESRHGLTKAGPRGPGVQLWVLEEEGRYLGHLWLTERDDAVTGTRLLEVTTVALARESRGLGHGRLLMAKAEQEAHARGIRMVELSVAGNNRRARDLFRDLGYETVRRTMRKRLPPG